MHSRFPSPPSSRSAAAELVSELPSLMKCLLSVAREMQICADHISVGAGNCSQSDQIISVMERDFRQKRSFNNTEQVTSKVHTLYLSKPTCLFVNVELGVFSNFDSYCARI